ncbi:MAG: pantoate--beta-alanine ligase [Deltaproteobacteria bacterium]|nr:pantoate--beta-alanine ligase [Deltaproteobacteria bacterium]MBW2659505.1 pantoate--beta-alanine ligase [Deltaproteobacteria bacterium]
MKTIRSIRDISSCSKEWKNRGYRVSLVPTMGCLHEGHLSLMRLAKKYSDKTIVSLFVNSMQFGPNEDLASYPRQFETDCRMAENAGVDALFYPTSAEMYPENFQTSISVNLLSQGMCGKDRPVHFGGVVTVVTKLFNITMPDVAVFGKKDYQQLLIIRRLVRDLNYNIEVIGAPIFRERDGLAMSSRNKYLDREERQSALCLSRAILAARDLVSRQPGIAAAVVLEKVKGIIAKAGGRLEYAVIVDEKDLSPVKIVDNESVLALAVKIGEKIRLIDNGKLITVSPD